MLNMNPNHLKGVYREMCMEEWQRLGVSNTFQLTNDQILRRAHSIQMMEELIRENLGEIMLIEWNMDIIEQYNGGRRACV